MCACLHALCILQCTVYACKHRNSVYAGSLVLTWKCPVTQYIMQDLLHLCVACINICLGTKEAGMKLKEHAQIKSHT